MSDSVKTVSATRGARPDTTFSATKPSQRALCVEGWRFIHHSYALVNQWQLLALLKRPDIRLGIRDVPFYRDHWHRSTGLFNPDEEKVLAAIPHCDASDLPTATLRVSFPFNFSLHPEGRIAVFGTSEYQAVPQSYSTVPVDLGKLSESESLVMITPSRWSREGFLRFGLRPEQVRVVPHGVDCNIFCPGRDEHGTVPAKDATGPFTFANASTMTHNKGIDLLLRAFAAVAEKRPDTRLHLKGADSLYQSKDRVTKLVSELPSHSRRLVLDRLHYYGDTYSVRGMAQFYQAADAYVSPYRAEGFNLPVLEASACGTPVLCTKGGSTDDFMKSHFALFVDSQTVPYSLDGLPGFSLEPDFDHLVESMFRVMEDDTWRQSAADSGAAHAALNFNWDSVTDRLLDAIFVAP